MEADELRSRRLQVLNGQIDYAWMEKVAEDSSSRTPGLGIGKEPENNLNT